MPEPQEHSKLPEGYRLGSSRHLYQVDKALSNGGFANTYVCTNLLDFCPSECDTGQEPGAARLPNIESGKKVVVKEHYPLRCVHRKGEGETDAERYTIVPNPGCESMFAMQEESFVREANVLWKLYREAQCPNIIPVLHVCTIRQTRITFFVMPFLTGGTLENWRGCVSPGNVMFILLRLLNALKVVHGKGMQHRDIKPKNVMIAHKNDIAGVVDGEPVLIDFGLAGNGSASGINGGTVAYMPWEQLQSARDQVPDAQSGPWTDFYSLGVTCYELITGTRPPDYRNRNPWTEDSYVPLSQQPEYVERFGANLLLGIDWALRIDYKKRWQNAEQWLEYLRKILEYSKTPDSGVPDLTPEPLPLPCCTEQQPPPPEPQPQTPQHLGRGRLVAVLAALVFAVSVAVALLVVFKEPAPVAPPMNGAHSGAGAPAPPKAAAISEEGVAAVTTADTGSADAGGGKEEARATKQEDRSRDEGDEFKQKLLRGIINKPRNGATEH